MVSHDDKREEEIHWIEKHETRGGQPRKQVAIVAVHLDNWRHVVVIAEQNRVRVELA